MSNFEHRITEDSTEFEKAFLKIYDGSLWTALDKMKDWQPPKPQQALPVVPELTQKQADTLNDYKNGSNSLLEYLRVEVKKKDYNRFARAWIDGYTVEKEQLYEVIINGLYLIKVMKYDNSKIHEFIEKDKLFKWEETGYKLTEQQIKKIDPRYMAFAVKVEEVEK